MVITTAPRTQHYGLESRKGARLYRCLCNVMLFVVYFSIVAVFILLACKHSQIQLRTLLNKNDSVIDVYSTLGHPFIPHVNKGNGTGMNIAEVKPVRTRHIQTQVNDMEQRWT
jgi:hypothetical protein